MAPKRAEKEALDSGLEKKLKKESKEKDDKKGRKDSRRKDSGKDKKEPGTLDIIAALQKQKPLAPPPSAAAEQNTENTATKLFAMLDGGLQSSTHVDKIDAVVEKVMKVALGWGERRKARVLVHEAAEASEVKVASASGTRPKAELLGDGAAEATAPAHLVASSGTALPPSEPAQPAERAQQPSMPEPVAGPPAELAAPRASPPRGGRARRADWEVGACCARV